MITAFDDTLLASLIDAPFKTPGPEALHRDGRVFFIGGNLPMLETLQTMHDSYCQESTDLLYLSFGDAGWFSHNLEMSRIIKKNFSVRLMGHIERIVSKDEAEQLYLAGIDLLDIQEDIAILNEKSMLNNSLERAASVFPRWAVSVSLDLSLASLDCLKRYVRQLLQAGIIPIVKIPEGHLAFREDEVKELFQTLADQWKEYAVPLRHFQPILRLSSPYVWRESGGMIRSAVSRFHNRQQLAASDLRRHLRTKAAEASFESAGL